MMGMSPLGGGGHIGGHHGHGGWWMVCRAVGRGVKHRERITEILKYILWVREDDDYIVY